MPVEKLQNQLDALLRELTAVVEHEATLFDELTGALSRSLVIFGAGGLGRKVLKGLRQVGIEPRAFADNSAKLWNVRIDGVEVLAPQEAARRFAESAAFVIAIWSEGADRRIPLFRRQLDDLRCRTVTSFVPLFRKYPEVFLPHGRIDVPSKALAASEDIPRAFDLLADRESRREFLDQLGWLLSLDFGELPAQTGYDQYFPHDLFDPLPDEVFVDCGAYNGDTLRALRKNCQDQFQRTIALEPEPENFAALQRYVASLPGEIAGRIEPLPLAAAACRGRLRFESQGLVSRASDTGRLVVDCLPLDEILAQENPTFIKMDIEGAELDAIEGGRATIQRNAPVLAVCAYHRQEHLWEIPLLIHGTCERYRFFLRRYGDEFGDVVCYALPPSRLLNLIVSEGQ